MKAKGPSPISDLIATLFAACFFLVFAAGFGGAGIMLALQGLRHHDWQSVCFAAPFILIGVLAALGGIWVIRINLREGKAKAAHPDEPWMWDADWAGGQIPDHAVGGTVGTWIFAVVVNGIAIPAAVGTTHQYLHTHDPKLLLGWIFVPVGIWMLILAIRVTARTAYFGKSVFSLLTLPASPGGTLAGIIHIPQVLRPTGPVKLHLTCIETHRSGNSTSQSVVWEDEEQLDGLPPAKMGSDIPAYFTIPADVPETGHTSTSREISWKLEVKAPTAEISYLSKFKLPVFKVANPIVLPVPAPVAKLQHHETQPPAADMPGITLTRLADGRCVVQFAAGRNWGLAIWLTAMGAVLTGAFVLMVQNALPLVPEIVVALFAAILDISTLNAWLSSATITVRHHGLHIARGLPMLRRQRDVPAAGIKDIVVRFSTSLGNTTYYTLSAMTSANEVSIVSGVRGKHNADFIAAEMKQAMGMAPAVPTA